MKYTQTTKHEGVPEARHHELIRYRNNYYYSHKQLAKVTIEFLTCRCTYMKGGVYCPFNGVYTIYRYKRE